MAGARAPGTRVTAGLVPLPRSAVPGTRVPALDSHHVSVGRGGTSAEGSRAPASPGGQGAARETRTAQSAGSPLAGGAGRPPSPATRPCVLLCVAVNGGQGPRHWPGCGFRSLGVTQGHHTRSPSCSEGRGVGVPSLLGNSG